MKLTQILAATGATLALALTGCAGDAEPTPTVTVTETVAPEPVEPPEPQTQQTMTDEEFAALVYTEYPQMASVPVFEMVGLVESACSAFDRGASLQEVLEVVAANSKSQEDLNAMAFTIGAGVEVYCSEHGNLANDSI